MGAPRPPWPASTDRAVASDRRAAGRNLRTAATPRSLRPARKHRRTRVKPDLTSHGVLASASGRPLEGGRLRHTTSTDVCPNLHPVPLTIITCCTFGGATVLPVKFALNALRAVEGELLIDAVARANGHRLPGVYSSRHPAHRVLFGERFAGLTAVPYPEDGVGPRLSASASPQSPGAVLLARAFPLLEDARKKQNPRTFTNLLQHAGQLAIAPRLHKRRRGRLRLRPLLERTLCRRLAQRLLSRSRRVSSREAWRLPLWG